MGMLGQFGPPALLVYNLISFVVDSCFVDFCAQIKFLRDSFADDEDGDWRSPSFH